MKDLCKGEPLDKFTIFFSLGGLPRPGSPETVRSSFYKAYAPVGFKNGVMYLRFGQWV